VGQERRQRREPEKHSGPASFQEQDLDIGLV
jgi:hypothetical protein